MDNANNKLFGDENKNDEGNGINATNNNKNTENYNDNKESNEDKNNNNNNILNFNNNDNNNKDNMNNNEGNDLPDKENEENMSNLKIEQNNNDNNIFDISNINDNGLNKEDEEKEDEKEKKIDDPKKRSLRRQDTEKSEINIIKQKQPDIYSLDSNLLKDQESSDNPIQNFEDLISHNSNPPKKNEKDNKQNLNLKDNPDNEDNNGESNPEGIVVKNQNKKNNQSNRVNNEDLQIKEISSKSAFKGGKDSDEFDEKKNDKENGFFKRLFNKMNDADLNSDFNFNDELLTLEEFSNKYKTFPSIYKADLKKHHLLYFTFLACNDNNNLFLKLSFFSLSINLYFGVNTMLIFNSNISDAYFNPSKNNIIYILMNLLLPFIICFPISHLIKRFIMPQYILNKIIEKIQSNEKLKGEIGINEMQQKNPEKGKKRKHDIKNQGKKKSNFDKELEELEKELISIYKCYIKKVIIYYIAASLVLLLNWYMMTSFCAIFKNTGVKLIVNSFISLLASFILPLILGLLPSGLGVFAIKLKNNVIFKIYKFINILL